ncbi:MAG: hypothetical protein LBD29_07775 [Treponema sp.]|nr:hypothetical protein [Treponema sp.]
MDFETKPQIMRPIGIVCFAFALSGVSVSALDVQAYRAAFAYNCLEAELYIEEIQPLLGAALEDPMLTSVGIAVIFPELTRYSYIRDVAETKLLELSYILGGNTDFSIGLLQMKPSFAKMIEDDSDDYCKQRFPSLFQTGADEQKTRGLRILRLKSLQRQVEYLAVFLRLMTKTFPQFSGEPETMVRIFSAAYNAGYKLSLQDLEVHAESYYFPYGKYGKSGTREQYSYTEIALDYYTRTKL